MDPTVFTWAALKILLDNLLTGTLTPKLLSAKAQPFVNNVDPGPGAALANFTLATFVDGATAKTITWGEAFFGGSNQSESVSGVLQWNWNSGTTETIYGVVLLDSTGGLLGYARLTTPKVMATTDDSFPIVFRVGMPLTGYLSPSVLQV